MRGELQEQPRYGFILRSPVLLKKGLHEANDVFQTRACKLNGFETLAFTSDLFGESCCLFNLH